MREKEKLSYKKRVKEKIRYMKQPTSIKKLKTKKHTPKDMMSCSVYIGMFFLKTLFRRRVFVVVDSESESDSVFGVGALGAGAGAASGAKYGFPDVCR